MRPTDEVSASSSSLLKVGRVAPEHLPALATRREITDLKAALAGALAGQMVCESPRDQLFPACPHVRRRRRAYKPQRPKWPHMAQSADGCDFVIVDLDDAKASQIANFLMGRGTPLIKMARRSAGRVLPERLLGSAPLRRAAAADELVMYWSDLEEFASRLRQQISRATTDRTELTDFAAGHRYFRSADLRGQPRKEQVQLIVSRLDELMTGAADLSVGRERVSLVEAGRTSVDVAVITVLEEEYGAVYRLLKRVRQVTGSATLDNQHAWVVGEVDSPTVQAPYTVALAMSSRAGTNAAVITTKNTLQAFNPRCVLVVGVAGGSGDLNLADVVVADRICAYEYGKVDRGFHPRPDLDSPTDAGLAAAARTLSARHPGWYSELDQPERLRRLRPRIVVGKVASGDKVVDDPTDAFFASVMRSQPQLRAVEMEGAGAAAAIQDARETRRTVRFSMIRGISDLPREPGPHPGSAGQSAHTETRDSWKVPAAAAAAATAIQLIRLSWPQPPRAATQR